MIKKILCCIDFSSNSDKAVDMSLDLAEKYNAQLHFLHVIPPIVNPVVIDVDIVIPEETDIAISQQLEERIRQDYASKAAENVESLVKVKAGHVSSEILNYLEEEKIDIVILGAYGLSGVELVLFGSVAKRIAHKASCSVMIVRENK